jgi:hypothetical protein
MSSADDEFFKILIQIKTNIDVGDGSTSSKNRALVTAVDELLEHVRPDGESFTKFKNVLTTTGETSDSKTYGIKPNS